MSEVLECQKRLMELDGCALQCDDLYAVLDALYDIRGVVDEQAKKYVELYNQLLRQFGVERVGAPGQYDFPAERGEAFRLEKAKLDEREIPFERRTIPRFNPITPGQYRMLRYFVDFKRGE